MTWQRMPLEYGIDGLQIELRRQVHRREVFFVKHPDRFALFRIALLGLETHVLERVEVALGVHRHEGHQLHVPGIYTSASTQKTPRHGADQIAFKPFKRLALRE